MRCGAVKRVLRHESTRFETGRVCPTAVGWVKEWVQRGRWVGEVSGWVMGGQAGSSGSSGVGRGTKQAVSDDGQDDDDDRRDLARGALGGV